MTANRNRLIIGGVIAAIVLVVITFPLWSPYFINDVVDEAFPALTAAQRDSIRAMPDEQQTVLVEMADDNPDMAADTAVAMMEDDTEVSDDMPAEPTALVSGAFGEFDPVHRGSGTATIYELEDGSRVLRFEDFQVTNGPQLNVRLISNIPNGILDGINPDYVDLGPLKGNIGNQNYEIPDDVNLDDYVAVVIYCVPFSVNFSVAPFS